MGYSVSAPFSVDWLKQELAAIDDIYRMNGNERVRGELVRKRSKYQRLLSESYIASMVFCGGLMALVARLKKEGMVVSYNYVSCMLDRHSQLKLGKYVVLRSKVGMAGTRSKYVYRLHDFSLIPLSIISAKR